ncbi:MAG: hypothetical protein ACYSUQ_00185 [Planctomycetota bacterium]|jgi:hypothetical protein
MQEIFVQRVNAARGSAEGTAGTYGDQIVPLVGPGYEASPITDHPLDTASCLLLRWRPVLPTTHPGQFGIQLDSADPASSVG